MYTKDQITSAIWEELKEAQYTGDNNDRAYEIIGVVAAALERIKKPGLPPIPEPILTDEDVRQWEGDKAQRSDYAAKEGSVWVKASEFKYIAGAPYHAKDNLSKGAGKFDMNGDFIWGDGSVTYANDQGDLRILDESVKLVEWDSERIIGQVKDRFKELEEKEWDWRSFYGGWMEGRADMLAEGKGWGRYKEGNGSPLTQEHADLIREANNRDLGGTAGREDDAVDPFDFYNWLIENHWEEHSSGTYWHRSKDRHQWPPEETCEKGELISKFKQQKEK